jgi:hypothetical protein
VKLIKYENRSLCMDFCSVWYYRLCFIAAIEGCGGVPPIRPLETLHNALSLRQLDSFLEVMTSAPLFRTPASSPPKNPSTPLPSTASMPPPPLHLQSPSSSEYYTLPCTYQQSIVGLQPLPETACSTYILSARTWVHSLLNKMAVI